jgi:GntR family transcriptional repressor for pyruvate dehydrogenase complex
MVGTRLPRRSFRRGRLSEQLTNELEGMIMAEFPEVGLALPNEDELAARFGVSRIVVREAMKILEDRGLVEVRAGRGTHTAGRAPDKVKEALARTFKNQPIPSQADMESMLELRQTLEEMAAELAAVRATPADLKEMEQSLAAMEADGPEEETIAADLRFHRAVAQASHNRYLGMVVDPLTHVFLQQIKLANSYSVGPELHRNIFDAIRQGNPIAARQAARRLMRITRNHTVGAIEALSATAPVAAGS